MRTALARLDRAMDQAVEHTGLANDAERQEALLSQIGALFNTSALLDLHPPVPWEPEPPQPSIAMRALLAPADEEDELRRPAASPVDIMQRSSLDQGRPRLLGPGHRGALRAPRGRHRPRDRRPGRHVQGVPLLWKLEAKAHALIEAAYLEHGIVDTGQFPVIPPAEKVLSVNGSHVG